MRAVLTVSLVVAKTTFLPGKYVENVREAKISNNAVTLSKKKTVGNEKKVEKMPKIEKRGMETAHGNSVTAYILIKYERTLARSFGE